MGGKEGGGRKGSRRSPPPPTPPPPCLLSQHGALGCLLRKRAGPSAAWRSLWRAGEERESPGLSGGGGPRRQREDAAPLHVWWQRQRSDAACLPACALEAASWDEEVRPRVSWSAGLEALPTCLLTRNRKRTNLLAINSFSLERILYSVQNKIIMSMLLKIAYTV